MKLTKKILKMALKRAEVLIDIDPETNTILARELEILGKLIENYNEVIYDR